MRVQHGVAGHAAELGHKVTKQTAAAVAAAAIAITERGQKPDPSLPS